MPTVVVTDLPVPIRIDLPDGWKVVDQEQDLPDGVAIAAAHPHPDRGVTASITIDGDRWPPHQTLEDIAASSVTRIAEVVDDGVQVRSRTEVGTADAPGLTQSLSLRNSTDGELRDLIQDQVYLGMIDEHDPSLRVVIRLVLTASSEQHDQVVGQYQAAVSSVVPETGQTTRQTPGGAPWA